MILNGKCADRFKDWLENSNHTPWVVFFESLPPLVQYAYYVEWFDAQGVFIQPHRYKVDWGFVIEYNGMVMIQEDKPNDFMMSRTEALKAAIEKGNLIFNER